MLASGISCLLWSLSFVLLGYWASGTALEALAFTRRTDVQLGIAAVVMLVLLAMVISRRRRFAERTAEVLSGEHISMMSTEERATPPWPALRKGPRSGEP